MPLHHSDNAIVPVAVLSSLDDSNRIPIAFPDSDLAPDRFFFFPLLSVARIIFPNWKLYQVLPWCQARSWLSRTLQGKSKIINKPSSASRLWLQLRLQPHFSLCPSICPPTPSAFLSVILNPLQLPKHTSLPEPPGLGLGSLFYLQLFFASLIPLQPGQSSSVVPSTGRLACDIPFTPSFLVITRFLVISHTKHELLEMASCVVRSHKVFNL